MNTWENEETGKFRVMARTKSRGSDKFNWPLNPRLLRLPLYTVTHGAVDCNGPSVRLVQRWLTLNIRRNGLWCHCHPVVS